MKRQDMKSLGYSLHSMLGNK